MTLGDFSMNLSRPCRRRAGGFTLAEMLIAILVLAAGLAMAANLLVKSNQTAAHSRDLTSAALVARTQLDRLLEMPFAELRSERAELTGRVNQGSVTFNYTTALEDIDEQLVRVHLTVSWRSREGVNQKQFTCIRGK